jgi:hypothetical protein
MGKENNKDKNNEVSVLYNNEYLLDMFIYEVYGSPSSWSGGTGLIVKGYPGFDIESRKEPSDDRYKVILKINNISGDIKDNLVRLATSKNLSFSDVHKMSEQIKGSLLWRLDN